MNPSTLTSIFIVTLIVLIIPRGLRTHPPPLTTPAPLTDSSKSIQDQVSEAEIVAIVSSVKAAANSNDHHPPLHQPPTIPEPEDHPKHPQTQEIVAAAIAAHAAATEQAEAAANAAAAAAASASSNSEEKGEEKVEEPTTSPIEIFVPSGPIVGEKYHCHGRNIMRFRGIPYAEPPVGRNRFRKPVAISKFQQPVQAKQWPHNCVQSRMDGSGASANNGNLSENCLYLNVWSPDVNVNEHNLRPVIVYIHGGSLLFGSNTHQLYDAETLSSMADAVVVTINYRVATLGFLYSQKLDEIKGNQGLWDQALAIKWVTENIRYFGGNPKQITLMGNSAGSWSVSFHLLSPITRDLFQNAIMLSGAALNQITFEPERVVQKMLIGIRRVGCATIHDTEIDQTILDCLEHLDAKVANEIWQNDDDYAVYGKLKNKNL